MRRLFGGDPVKRGEVPVKLADLENPPKQLMAGGRDAISAMVPVLEQRLTELHAYEELSKSTDGSF
ncbi:MULTISPECIES: hypothetical protein [Rhizobium]|uniref:Uncharacterized protein n=1 Tax=Rhizobium esperanzae TaxID=1967781 RepID=A0A7W6UID0_9HYPH|nr:MULTISPECIES: hypothetical protein [Rhizobium]MBB4438763.1 hypothetical protein [Rhizobium esperanzae]MDH6201459.1 hypothetical protein [Rhizobium leguminosarum]